MVFSLFVCLPVHLFISVCDNSKNKKTGLFDIFYAVGPTEKKKLLNFRSALDYILKTKKKKKKSERFHFQCVFIN